MSRWSSALADDQRFIWASEELAYKIDWRMVFVWRAIGLLLADVDCYDCPKRRELWLSIIEGNVDDDVWLWVDGDEKWLTQPQIPCWGEPNPKDWHSAQLALRRRVTQQRYPPATARNERVRSATPQQRVCAITWLIASSKAVAEVFASHGCTPPTFRTPKIADTFRVILGKHWDAFPSQTGAWESALSRSKEDGCTCSPANCLGMRQWFDMMVWLEDIPPTSEVVYGCDGHCLRCRSLLESRYEDIAAKCTVTSYTSWLDAFFNYCSHVDNTRFSRRLSPTAKLLADRILKPLMKKHAIDMRYLPSVNGYPECLRPQLTKLLCGSYLSCEDGLLTTEPPDNIYDGVHDPWVALGIMALESGCGSPGESTDLHDGNWHAHFPYFLLRFLECFDMPEAPLLPSGSLALCRLLDRGYLKEQLSFGPSDRGTDNPNWVQSDQDGRRLPLSTVVTAAVATCLRNKVVDLYGCRSCQNICMAFFTDTSPVVGFEVTNSSKRGRLGPPSTHIRTKDDALGDDLSSPCQGSLEVIVQEPAGMEAFTSMLRNPTLSEDEIYSQLARKLHKLRQFFDSFGFDISNCFQRSDSSNSSCPGGTTSARHLPGRGISRSLELSTSGRVEEIKVRLLDMLRELGLPYERLPWYTLEKDLKKHGFALVNWPAGILRKRGNRGIRDLSAVEVNTLYEAITCLDESRRLRICRRPSALTASKPRSSL
ncbi:hypothetical protein EDD16DRAFT_469250 [Pisolithus croceorrhizus]|nr:hypothetical protein EDD16DRAFT_469250 [Pisolithus croceorrhizus]KAI6158418.1 hypothetical protein EDD17DRAFT_1006579 [Pisolithus thermaeus]